MTTIVPEVGGTTVSGAILSYDSQTGLVALVIPYASAIKRTNEAGVIAYTGKI
ncbi:MAG TPA: hypothetical protein VGL56_17635 [Fimbriimonadaceae bacterium]